MTAVKKGLYSFLKGSFLTNDSAFKNWKIIIFLMLLMLVIIYSSHSAERKVFEISELNKKKRELRAEYVDTGTILMRLKMESSVRQKAKLRGLKPSETPPKKIKVTIKD
jgi:hypothetical protein